MWLNRLKKMAEFSSRKEKSWSFHTYIAFTANQRNVLRNAMQLLCWNACQEYFSEMHAPTEMTILLKLHSKQLFFNVHI